MDIEERLSNVENILLALINKVNKNNEDQSYSNSSHSININHNLESMNAEEDAICELSETTETSIAALEQALCDLSEEIGGQ